MRQLKLVFIDCDKHNHKRYYIWCHQCPLKIFPIHYLTTWHFLSHKQLKTLAKTFTCYHPSTGLAFYVNKFQPISVSPICKITGLFLYINSVSLNRWKFSLMTFLTWLERWLGHFYDKIINSITNNYSQRPVLRSSNRNLFPYLCFHLKKSVPCPP